MDRAIFDLNASVKATSLYILLSALMDQGAPPTLKLAREKWNGTEEELMEAVEELTRRGILEIMPPLTEDKHMHPTPRFKWK